MAEEKITALSVIEALQPNESSLTKMIAAWHDKLFARASEELRKAPKDKQDQFLSRLIYSIAKNENLKECFNTPEGKISIFKLVDDCFKTGLSLDTHAYAVPYSKKNSKGVFYKEAHFEIKRQGFHAILCGGDKPIFKDLRWGVVYEKEKADIKINRATGEVNHPIAIESDRGKPIGCWVQSIKLDGITKEAEFYPISYIYNLRDNHSKTYNKYLDDMEKYKAKKIDYQPTAPAWVVDEIPMIEKTAIKAFCRPYADVKEELANAYYSENDNDDNYNPSTPIYKLAEKIIDKATVNLGEEAELKRETKEEKPDAEPEFHTDGMEEKSIKDVKDSKEKTLF